MSDFNALAEELIRGVLSEHPEWQGYAEPYGPTDDPEAEEGSVKFVVPSPSHPKHCLELVLRGNTIEVAYDCGTAGARAEQQFVLAAGGAPAGALVADVRQFVRGLCAGQVVVVREQLGGVSRTIRRDGATELARFRSLDEAKAMKPAQYLAIHSWSTGAEPPRV